MRDSAHNFPIGEYSSCSDTWLKFRFSILSSIFAPKMFANTVNRRTKTIISRPLSLALSINTELETGSETASSSSSSSFTTHSNDSATTLVNEILVMQIAKESKDYEPSASTPLEYQHPLLRQYPMLEDQHPLLRQQSVSSTTDVSIRTYNTNLQSYKSNRNSKCSSQSWPRTGSTRRDDGKDRYSTMPLVLESYL
jgi:hypothetical protein